MIEDLNKIVLDLKDGLLNLIPKIIIALIVLGIGYLVARLIKYLVIRLVNYIGQLINQRYKNINLGQAATFIGTAFLWIILFSTFLLISDILGLTVVTTGIESILRYIPNILAAILILVASNVIGKLLSELITTFSARVGFPYGATLGKITRSLILLTAIIIVIDQIGIEVTFLINLINIILAASLFGAAIAFGLGARTSIGNILAAFYVRKFYKEGDHVKIGEIEGRITKIEATFVSLDAEAGQFNIPAKEFNEKKSLLIKKK
jgi:hypothetical protein